MFSKKKIELGDKVRDQITGFEGVVTSRVNYISGCDQALVAPHVKADGGLVDSQWFDIQRLVVVTKKMIKLDNNETPGADAPAPRR